MARNRAPNPTGYRYLVVPKDEDQRDIYTKFMSSLNGKTAQSAMFEAMELYLTNTFTIDIMKLKTWIQSDSDNINKLRSMMERLQIE